MRALYSDYFCGNQASEYARENGFLDYATLAKAFDAVLSNNIMSDTENAGFYWEQIAGMIDNSDEIEEEQDRPPEIFQFFIVSGAGAEIIQEWTDDPVFYCDALDLYLWGVTHWGTSWDYVLTDIKLNAGEKALET